jgi:23S rRNA (adenine-N6)-dimethyltransferase
VSGYDRAPDRQPWGWYRLADEFAGALVETAGFRAGDLVLDLGAGDGVITRLLVERGAHVLAFELHPRRASRLAADFADEDTVKVVRADIAELRLPRRRFHVVANPPFAHASRVLTQLTSRHSALAGASIVLPISVAGRWQHRLIERRAPWTLSIVSRLPRSAFTPRPRVDCCIALLDLRPERRARRCSASAR